MAIHWKAVEQHFTAVVLFVFQLYIVCNFEKKIDFKTLDLIPSGVKGLRVNNNCYLRCRNAVDGRWDSIVYGWDCLCIDLSE